MTRRLGDQKLRASMVGCVSPKFTPAPKTQKEIDFQGLNLYIFHCHFRNFYPFVNCIENPPRGHSSK